MKLSIISVKILADAQTISLERHKNTKKTYISHYQVNFLFVIIIKYVTCARHVQVMNKNISYSGSVRQGLFHIIFI